MGSQISSPIGRDDNAQQMSGRLGERLILHSLRPTMDIPASEVFDIVQLTSYHSHVKRTGHGVLEVLPDIQVLCSPYNRWNVMGRYFLSSPTWLRHGGGDDPLIRELSLQKVIHEGLDPPQLCTLSSVPPHYLGHSDHQSHNPRHHASHESPKDRKHRNPIPFAALEARRKDRVRRSTHRSHVTNGKLDHKGVESLDDGRAHLLPEQRGYR